MFLLPYGLELDLHIKWENSHISVFFVRLFASLSLSFPSYDMHCLSLQALCDGNCVLLCFFGAKQEAKPAIETCTAIAFKICAVKPMLWWTYICLLLKSSIKTNLRAITTATSNSLFAFALKLVHLKLWQHKFKHWQLSYQKEPHSWAEKLFEIGLVWDCQLPAFTVAAVIKFVKASITFITSINGADVCQSNLCLCGSLSN